MSMKRINGGWVAGLIVGACLGLPGRVGAGPYVNVMQPCDCPPTHYSAFHVLTPIAYRWAAWCRGPCRYTFAKILHPDIPPTDYITKYHCPSINPLQFSVINYPGLGGPPPGSTYQSPPAAPKEMSKEKERPQELPPPTKAEAPELLPAPKEESKK
jgi:hypothetical protein